MRVLLVSGSLRAGSTNTALVRTAAAVAPAGVDAEVYEALASLPHFNPDDDRAPLHPAVADLRARLGAADAVLFCTPEYAGALPRVVQEPPGLVGRRRRDLRQGRRLGQESDPTHPGGPRGGRGRARLPARGARLHGLADRRGGVRKDPADPSGRR